MPGISGFSLPHATSNLTDALGKSVEYDRVRIAAFAKFRPADGVHRAVAAAIKDPLRVEDRDAELALEMLQQAEHSVNRTA